MSDELQAALARAEAAEAEVERLKLETLRANNEKKRADHYEAQGNEAFATGFTAGAEAMREACVKTADRWSVLNGFELRSMAIPAQEGK